MNREYRRATGALPLTQQIVLALWLAHLYQRRQEQRRRELLNRFLPWFFPLECSISFINATNNSGNALSNINFTVPTNTQDGDWMIAVVSWYPTLSATLNAPAGGTWTLIATGSAGAGDVSGSNGPTQCSVYRRKASGETAGTTTYNWASSGAGCYFAGGIATFRGVDANTPMDAAATTGGTTASTTPTGPTITTVSPNAMLVTCFTGNSTLTKPGSETEDINVVYVASQHMSSYLGHEALGAAGSTGTRVGSSASASYASVTVALRPIPDAATGFDFWNQGGALRTSTQGSSRALAAGGFLFDNSFPLPPQNKQDDPTYFDFWNRGDLTRRADIDRVRTATAWSEINLFPVPPQNKQDDPRYWEFWTYGALFYQQAAALWMDVAQAFTEVIGYDYPPPQSKQDDPVYWAFWELGNKLAVPANDFRARALLASLLAEPPQRPPAPTDDPIYFRFWELGLGLSDIASSARARNAQIAELLDQFPQRPPFATDDPQYWKLWELGSQFDLQADAAMQRTVDAALALSTKPSTDVPVVVVQPDQPAPWATWSIPNPIDNRARLFTPSQPPPPQVKADDPQYWDFWGLGQRLAAPPVEYFARALQELLLARFPQTPPAPTDDPSYFRFWEMARTFARASDDRQMAAMVDVLLSQPPQKPPARTDDLRYWAFWELAATFSARDGQARIALLAAKLGSEYPQTPPNPTDDPVYFRFWELGPRLSETSVQARTDAIVSLLQSEYPEVPPAKTDDPVYWTFWELGRRLNSATNEEARARAIELPWFLANPPQTPPKPTDNPQYWKFWQLGPRIAAPVVEAAMRASMSALLDEPPQTPPAATDDPIYFRFWEYARVMALPGDDRRSAAIIAAMLGEPPQTPPAPTDNRGYWRFWEIGRAQAELAERRRAAVAQPQNRTDAIVVTSDLSVGPWAFWQQPVSRNIRAVADWFRSWVFPLRRGALYTFETVQSRALLAFVTSQARPVFEFEMSQSRALLTQLDVVDRQSLIFSTSQSRGILTFVTTQSRPAA